MTKVMVIAGEFSGDLLAADVMRVLKQKREGIQFVGLGGPKMAAQGLNSLFDIEETNIMGLVEVLPRIPKLLKRVDELVALAEAEKVDALLTVDAPDFSLRVAEKVKKKLHVPCIHYVSPQVWAWKQGRVKKMRGFLDHVLALFPFEPDIYKRHSVPCTFVGHPVYERMRDFIPEPHNIATNFKAPKLAILPGSRRSVMHRMFPVMVDAYFKIQFENPMLKPVVFMPRENDAAFLKKLCPKSEDFTFVRHDFTRIQDCTAALVTSGTSNLELAMLGLPMAVGYKMHPITHWIADKLVNVPYISPVNWVAGSKVVPELIQQQCTAGRFTKYALPLLKSSPERIAQESALRNVREALHAEVDPSEKAAEIILRYIS